MGAFYPVPASVLALRLRASASLFLDDLATRPARHDHVSQGDMIQAIGRDSRAGLLRALLMTYNGTPSRTRPLV
jgi:hypothetical protein